MMKTSSVITLMAISFGASAAFAEDPAKMPMPQKAGTETRALSPIAVDGKIKGKMPAGAMAKDSPEMVTSGEIDCEWEVNNLWLVCDIEETMGKGKDAKKWYGHLALGYDFLAKEYRGTMVDNFGASTIMNGKIEGTKLTLTSMVDMMMDGKRCKGRFTYDWSNPKAIKLLSESSTNGEPFKVMEQATLEPTKREALPSPSA